MSGDYCSVQNVATLMLIILLSIAVSSVLSITITYVCMKRRYSSQQQDRHCEHHTTVVCNKNENNDSTIKMPPPKDNYNVTCSEQNMKTAPPVPSRPIHCPTENMQTLLPTPTKICSHFHASCHEESVFESVRVYDRPEGFSMKRSRRDEVRNTEDYEDVVLVERNSDVKDATACKHTKNISATSIANQQRTHFRPMMPQSMTMPCCNIKMSHVYDIELPTGAEFKKSE